MWKCPWLTWQLRAGRLRGRRFLLRASVAHKTSIRSEAESQPPPLPRTLAAWLAGWPAVGRAGGKSGGAAGTSPRSCAEAGRPEGAAELPPGRGRQSPSRSVSRPHGGDERRPQPRRKGAPRRRPATPGVPEEAPPGHPQVLRPPGTLFLPLPAGAPRLSAPGPAESSSPAEGPPCRRPPRRSPPPPARGRGAGGAGGAAGRRAPLPGRSAAALRSCSAAADLGRATPARMPASWGLPAGTAA